MMCITKYMSSTKRGVPCNLLHMQSIHRDTALAILSDNDGLKTLKTDYKPAPLLLLIKDMPGTFTLVIIAWCSVTMETEFLWP